MKISVSITMLCSCEIAANSLSHSSRITAQRAKSRVRLLLIMVDDPAFDVLAIESMEEWLEYSNDVASNDAICVDSRTVILDEPELRKKMITKIETY